MSEKEMPITEIEKLTAKVTNLFCSAIDIVQKTKCKKATILKLIELLELFVGNKENELILAAAEIKSSPMTFEETNALLHKEGESLKFTNVIMLPARNQANLMREGVETIGDLIKLPPTALVKIQNITSDTVALIQRQFALYGLKLGMTEVEIKSFFKTE